MKESQFKFEYSWADLQPIRGLALTVFIAQTAGAVLGLLFPRFPFWFESLFFGGAIVTFPAFLIGLAFQARLYPGSISENKVMVRRCALIAFGTTVFAIAMPILGFGAAR